MKISIVFLLFTLIASSLSLKKKTNLCRFTLDGTNYDLNPLRRNENFYRAQGGGFHDYLINFCAPVTVPKYCSGSSGHPVLRVHWQSNDECNFISGRLIAPNVKYKKIEKGIQVTYDRGEYFEQGGRNMFSKTQIDLKCNTDRHLSIQFVEEVERQDSMIYKFSGLSRYACGRREPKPTPRPTPTPNPGLCKIGSVDLKKLQSPTDIKVQGEAWHDMEINFCKNLRHNCDGRPSQSTIFEWKQPHKECTQASGELSKKNTLVEWLDPSDHSKGVVLRYLNGQPFQVYRDVVLPTETRIEIECDSQTDLFPITWRSTERVGDILVFKLYTKSRHACPASSSILSSLKESLFKFTKN